MTWWAVVLAVYGPAMTVIGLLMKRLVSRWSEEAEAAHNEAIQRLKDATKAHEDATETWRRVLRKEKEIDATYEAAHYLWRASRGEVDEEEVPPWFPT